MKIYNTDSLRNKDNFFSGSFESLRNHWEVPARAIKFRNGGTRTNAVKYMVHRLELDIHQGSWLDTATGSGFMQTQVSSSVSPCLHVGLDFSMIMLLHQDPPYGERVLGTTFQLPFRAGSFSLVTNIFSLSDYPDIHSAFVELCRVIVHSGTMAHLDYASGDEYWETRKRFHGRTDNQDKPIIGDIHLRNLEEIKLNTPSEMNITFQTLIEYQVSSKDLNSSFSLPETLVRRFIFSQFYKPRSIKQS